jgi:outer membrane lipoprotein-sorting protein
MKMRQLAFGLIAMTVAACAPTLPPNRVAVSDFQSLAGTYTGTMNEASELNRSVNLVLTPDGTFQMDVGDPKGFRTVGTMALVSDGSLTYQYNEMMGQGKVATGQGWVYEGDGRRAIVLQRGDGSTKTTVSKTLP